MTNLNENFFENNSEPEKCKEKLSNDVTIQFTRNFSGQCSDKTVYS